MKNGFFILFILLYCCGFAQNTSLTADEFEKKISANVQLLDVRTMDEFKAGYIKNSFLIDWLIEDQFKERIQYLDKNKPVYIYCASGGRSSAAAKWLRNNGFDTVLELNGGFIKWKSDNKPFTTVTPVKQITVRDYNLTLKEADVVLVDFGATWCPPCQKMEPVLQQLGLELKDNFKLLRIDAGVHTDMLKHLKIESLPTFVIYKNGKETWRKQGLVSLEEFKLQLK